MNSCRLFAVICLSGIFLCSQCDQTTQDKVEAEVEGSGEVLTHTDKVPVIDDELMTTRVPDTDNIETTRDSVKSTNEEVLTQDNKVTVSGSGDSKKKTASTEIVFIIAPAVVGTVALIAVVIAIVAIRRKGKQEKMIL